MSKLPPISIKCFPVRIPHGFVPREICTRAGKICPGQSAADGYKPRWGGGFAAPRGPSRTPHRAVDIMAAIGAEVLAVDNGIVQLRWVYQGEARPGAGLSKKGGYYVRVLHPWGVSYSAHLVDAPLVKAGQPIVAGQLLGYVGRSGNAMPGCPHLHLSIAHGKTLVDPVPLLKPLYKDYGWHV